MSECNSCGSAGSCSSKDGNCPSQDPVQQRLDASLGRIKHKIVVLSGKGGVGKTTVAVNLALSLSLAGKKVGLLDVDLHGPSVPRLLSLQGQTPHMEPNAIDPVSYSRNLSVMSVGFLLPSNREAVIWRGPAKIGIIRQFLGDVAWGELDYLVVDCPPGTGDEPLTVLQTLGQDAQAVVVTTPSQVAIDDVRRSLTFCAKLENPVIGLVENMSGYACPECKAVSGASTAGQELAAEMRVPFLGAIPMDPELARAGDEGFAYPKVFPDTATAAAMAKVAEPVLKLDD